MPEGQIFIQTEIKRLRDRLAAGSKNITISSALSSFYEKQGNLSLAKMHLESVISKKPDGKKHFYSKTTENQSYNACNCSTEDLKYKTVTQ